MLPKTALPDERRKKFRKLLESQSRPVRLLEAHNGLSALVAERTQITNSAGQRQEFDGIWVSGLTESASRGLPDIELLGLPSRLEMVREVSTVTSKPIVVDGDTGGTIDQLKHAIRMLEQLGASALIIEDKVFPKSNSLDFHKPQTLENPEIFAKKISEGKSAQLSKDFMLIARIEALVAGRDVKESLNRAHHYLKAGADAIVIHSRSKSPEEVFAFAKGYQDLTATLGLKVPLVSIPTIYNSVTETELEAAGFRVVIYANHLLRSAYKTMQETAAQILMNQRSLEVEPNCASLNSLFEALDHESGKSHA